MTQAAPARYVLKALLVDFFAFGSPLPFFFLFLPQTGFTTVVFGVFLPSHKSQRGQINSGLQEKSIKEQ